MDDSDGMSLFDIFSLWPNEAPHSFDEMPAFIQKLRRNDYNAVAEALTNWVLSINYHIEAEWDDRITSY